MARRRLHDELVRTGQPSLDKALAILFRMGWTLRDASVQYERAGFSRLTMALVNRSRGEIEVSTYVDRGEVGYDAVLRAVENQEIAEIVRERSDLMAEVENELALRALARLGTLD